MNSIRPASNVYLREIGYGAGAVYRYRAPRGPHIREVAVPGSAVVTSYRSGPYVIHAVTGPYTYRPPEGGQHEHWSIVFTTFRGEQCGKPGGGGHINEMVAVDGRLLKLFENNDDEVLFLDRPILSPPRVKPLQLLLDF